MKTKIRRLLLTAAAVLTLAVVFCFSAGAYDEYGVFEYSVEYGEVTIESVSEGASGIVVVPSEINGYPVTTIGGFAFGECEFITGVVVPETVNSIETYAFDECSRLKFIVFNCGGYLGSQVIWKCYALESLYFSDDITSISSEFNYVAYSDRSYVTYPAVYYQGSEDDWDYHSNFSAYSKIEYNHVHTYAPQVVKATLSADGSQKSVCGCGLQTTTAIPSIKTVSIPYTEYTYNGKAKTPAVTVKDRTGKTLKQGTDYKVTYASGRKAVGKYSVKVTFMGNYSGSKTLSFKVLPGKTSSIATSVTQNSVTLKWKAVSGASGYRVYVYDKSTGDYKSLGTTTELKYTAKKLNDGTTYKFKVLAYTKKDSGTFWASKFTTVKATTKKAVKVDITKTSASVYVAKTTTLKANAYPDSVTVKWKSSDTSIAKVSQKGVVTGVKKGKATITAYFTYKNKTYKDTCVINVLNPSISLNKTSASVGRYDSLTLKATVKPSGVKVTWASSNTSIAKVSGSGKITPVKAGTCKITASFKYAGKTYKATCSLTVKNQNPVEVTNVDWEINSAGGVEPNITIKNNTNKDIKYIVLETAYKNRFGDPAYCEIRDDYTRNLRVSSGLMAKETRTFYWDPAIYNYNVHRVDVDHITVTFVDGTEVEYDYAWYWYDSYYYYQ